MSLFQTNHRKTHKQLVTLTKHSSFPDLCVFCSEYIEPQLTQLINTFSTRMQLKVTCAENSKFMAQSNGSGL